MNVFNSVKGLHPKRNAFSAHTYRNDFTAKLGVNIPCYIQHVAPATRVKVSASALVRLQALISPIMDNIDFYVHFWQVPYRLIENDRFTQFISGEIESSDYDALFVTPYELAAEFLAVASSSDTLEDDYANTFGHGSLLDFLGYDLALFPLLIDDGEGNYSLAGGNNVTKFNFRELIAYYMLHTNWYMNENVPYFTNFVETVDEACKSQDLTSLAKLLALSAYNFGTTCLPHGWEKDYFTSALPNVQFGDPVTLPIAGTAPVSIPAQSGGIHIDFASIDKPDVDPPVDWKQGMSVSLTNVGGFTYFRSYDTEDDSRYIPGMAVKTPEISGTADLSEATAITINELRFANALQVFKERQMRFGRRRLEHYKGFFDVTPEDLRLQVPKYLGGGRIPINIADIEQTSQTSGSNALGHLAGKATAVAGGFAGFSTFCSEETLLIGICFAMPHITYAQSVSKFLLKTNDPYDYFNPSFEHLGEQAIDQIEVYSGSVQPSKEFGYTPRFNEYRFHLNELHGQFKSTLAFWTLGRIFDSQPKLNKEFIYMQPSAFDRIFAVSGQDPMLASMLFRQRIIQPVSKYGTPMLLA